LDGAWSAAPSARAVAAESPSDVAVTVDFARRHHLWRIVMHDRFVPSGCDQGQ
jgi:hypothetical protein